MSKRKPSRSRHREMVVDSIVEQLVGELRDFEKLTDPDQFESALKRVRAAIDYRLEQLSFKDSD